MTTATLLHLHSGKMRDFRTINVIRLVLVAGLAALAAGCDASSRFGDFGGQGSRAVAPPPPRQPTFIPAPSSSVTAQPLPPVSSQPLPPPGGVSSGLPPVGSSVPIESPPPVADLDIDAPPPSDRPRPRVGEPQPPPPQVAARPEPQPPSQPAGPPTRTAVTGNWTARDAAGGACRVTLSGTPTLDLYKASSSGCQTRELQRVSAWELRGDEVYLYETGGAIAARLRKSGAGFGGAMTKSGAPVTLSK
ncbi:MAG: AprI/Inh family metalloprotease inhibitor [Beijerinckiaceae bacterium]